MTRRKAKPKTNKAMKQRIGIVEQARQAKTKDEARKIISLTQSYEWIDPKTVRRVRRILSLKGLI